MAASPDTHHLRCIFSRLAPEFGAEDFFHGEIRGRLLERLPLFRLDPDVIVDLGCGCGAALAALEETFPGRRTLGIDSAFGMALETKTGNGAAVCSDATQLPLADNSVDLVFSNLALHYTDQLGNALAEVSRVLRPGGLFIFSVAGNQSFIELKEAWQDLPGAPQFDPLPELQPLGDALLGSGLSDPVLDSEALTVTYESPDKLLQELRAVTATRLTSRRHKGLTGKALWSKMRAACDAARNDAGVIPVSVEVVYGHAFGGNKGPAAVTEHPGEQSVPLSQLLGRKGKKSPG